MLKLLSRLHGVSDRRARFRTVIALVGPAGEEMCVSGELEGVIVDDPRGSHGFGYDPVFVPGESGGRTLAELSLEEKTAVSHRGRALRALHDALSGRGAQGFEAPPVG